MFRYNRLRLTHVLITDSVLLESAHFSYHAPPLPYEGKLAFSKVVLDVVEVALSYDAVAFSPDDR